MTATSSSDCPPAFPLAATLCAEYCLIVYFQHRNRVSPRTAQAQLYTGHVFWHGLLVKIVTFWLAVLVNPTWISPKLLLPLHFAVCKLFSFLRGICEWFEDKNSHFTHWLFWMYRIHITIDRECLSSDCLIHTPTVLIVQSHRLACDWLLKLKNITPFPKIFCFVNQTFFCTWYQDFLNFKFKVSYYAITFGWVFT